MLVDDLMTKTLVTIDLDDSLETVVDIFNNTGFHHLLVIESSELVGVVSDRDVLRSVSPNIDTVSETAKDRATLAKRVHQIMSRKLKLLHCGADVNDAVALLCDFPISCVPIVDKKLRPVGIITWRDIMKQLRKSGLP